MQGEKVARAAGRRHRAGEDRQPFSADLASMEASWASKGAALLQALRRNGTNLRYRVDLVPLPAAVADPRYGSDAFDLALAAKRFAFGEGPRVAGCWTCSKAWTPKRSLICFAVIEFINVNGGLLSGLCPSCTLGGNAVELLIHALARDFGIPRSDLRSVHPGGRA